MEIKWHLKSSLRFYNTSITYKVKWKPIIKSLLNSKSHISFWGQCWDIGQCSARRYQRKEWPECDWEFEQNGGSWKDFYVCSPWCFFQCKWVSSVDHQHSSYHSKHSYAIKIPWQCKPCDDTIEPISRKENNGSGVIKRCSSVKEAKDVNVDNSTFFLI